MKRRINVIIRKNVTKNKDKLRDQTAAVSFGNGNGNGNGCGAVDHYLDQVCSHIAARELHAEIRSELAAHMEDRIEEDLQAGYARAEAETRAIAQMGDPGAVGKELNKAHRPRMPWRLLGAVLLLAAISLLGMGSLQAGGFPSGNAFLPLQRQSIFTLLGAGLMLAGYYFDYRRFLKGSWWLYGAALFGIAFVGRYGLMVNGERSRWVMLPFSFSVDVVALSTYVFAIAVAGIFMEEKAGGRLGNGRNMLKEAGIIFIPLPFYVLAGGLPELAVYLASVLLLYAWMSGKWLRTAGAVALTAAAGIPYVWSHDQMRARILGAVDYNINPDSSGFVYKMLHETIQSAGWWGHGFGTAADKLVYPYADMLPAYMVHIFGWTGGLALIGAVLLLCAILRSVHRAVRDPYGQALILALSMVLAAQMIYGLSVLSGKMIIASLPFPFLSYGGHVLFEYAALGLMMGIYRRKDIIPAASRLAPGSRA
ncbi:FtsW/RodA/SpoVE family cell cycle protein [Paenibacillus tepidiphilus]|uniref:FtsW/RodA/SpoVE family cell cycle protein n=1 Tax=Paenibacillus tepidiphilus TaxID=2608683 RepID=UPI001239F4FF|nr:FtsW/RodA/SpoVE family cell cycle protein [Paenibacillus tepidiphilus]